MQDGYATDPLILLRERPLFEVKSARVATLLRKFILQDPYFVSRKCILFSVNLFKVNLPGNSYVQQGIAAIFGFQGNAHVHDKRSPPVLYNPPADRIEDSYTMLLLLLNGRKMRSSNLSRVLEDWSLWIKGVVYSGWPHVMTTVGLLRASQ